jgi:hypothetical protein
MKNTLQTFASSIRELTDSDLQSLGVLDQRLNIARDGQIEVMYAPFEHINCQARVLLVGITPGYTQAVNALRECRRQLLAGASDEEALKAAKQTGAFSGAMRAKLIAMLDAIGLHRWLELDTCEALFGPAAHLVHSTSVLRNPVFVKGKNYSGTPNMVQHPLLRQQLLEGFGQDARALPQAVFIPLGDKVTKALHFVADQGLLDRERILDGLPHPSGANAERIAYFLGRKPREELSEKTNSVKLDRAREGILAQVAALG